MTEPRPTVDLAALDRPPRTAAAQAMFARWGHPNFVKEWNAALCAIEDEAVAHPAVGEGLREALHAANVGCTWDEQIPKQRMCDPSWHDEQASRLRAALAADKDSRE